LAAEKEHANQLQGHIDAVKGITDPTKRAQAAKLRASQILNAGLAKDPQTQQMVQAMASGQFVPSDEQLEKFENGLQDHSTQVDLTLKQQQTATAAQQQQTSATEQQLKQKELAYYNQYGGGPGISAEQQQMTAFVKNPPAGYKPTPTDFLRYKGSIAPLARFQIESGGGGGAGAPGNQVAQRFGMSPTAFDQAAEKYFTTGQLPPLGRGVSGVSLNRALMNRAAEIHPEGNLASNEAAFAANKSSLTKLQSNFDQVTAFENTAGKNLDTFLATAKRVVDFGSPLVDRPLREAAQLAGGTDQAAFNAARTTALTEISKVLNSSNASGVLSDSARHEVEGLIGPGATLRQIYSAAQILKQDMANRHQAYQEQISDIQQRIGGAAGRQQQQKQQPSNDPFAQFGGRAR